MKAQIGLNERNTRKGLHLSRRLKDIMKKRFRIK